MGDDDDKESDLYKRWLAQKQGWDQTFAPVGDPANFQPIRYADGGRAGYASGGITGLRQGYFLGKLVKKIGRGVKKVLKSPIGKIGLGILGAKPFLPF